MIPPMVQLKTTRARKTTAPRAALTSLHRKLLAGPLPKRQPANEPQLSFFLRYLRTRQMRKTSKSLNVQVLKAESVTNKECSSICLTQR